jgi:hypothetical protein
MDPGNGDDIRDLGLNLAASDPLTMFDHTEFDGEGNLYPSRLSFVCLLGSLHLFFDVQLQRNRLAAQTFDDMHEDHDEYAVPVEGAPQQPWIDLPNSEKRTANAFTYSQCLGEDAKDRCINDLCDKVIKFLQLTGPDMAIEKWASAFYDAALPGSLISPTSIGKELRSFGSDLALSSPVDLFMSHEWVNIPTSGLKHTLTHGSEQCQYSDRCFITMMLYANRWCVKCLARRRMGIVSMTQQRPAP